MSDIGERVAKAMNGGGAPATSDEPSIGDMAFTELADAFDIPKEKRAQAKAALRAYIAAGGDDD